MRGVSELPQGVGGAARRALGGRAKALASALGAAALLAAAPAGAQLVVPAAPAPDATQDAADVRSVEQLLATLAVDARDRRVLGLSVGLGGGGLAAGFGVWLMVESDVRSVSEGPGFYILAAGATLMAVSVLNAVLPSHVDALRFAWRETAHLPVASRRANITRVLDELGEQARMQRRFAGAGLIALGAASVITAVLFHAVAREPGSAGSMELVLGVGGVGLMAAGVPALATRSPMENAALFWRAGGARPPPRFAGASVLPTRGGALVGVGLSF